MSLKGWGKITLNLEFYALSNNENKIKAFSET